MSNCLFVLILLWWRGRKRRARRRQQGIFERAYATCRRSDAGPFPHFLWREHGHFISYKPLRPSKCLVPPPLFRGRIHWGDARQKMD